MAQGITTLQEERVHAVYDIKVTQCLLRQLFIELFVVFGLPVYVTGFMYTFMCIHPFLCVESLLPFPPHLCILSSWQVLLGVIDKRQSFANEGVIFKLSMG